MSDAASDSSAASGGDHKALYVSPWRAGIAIAFMLTCGLGLAALALFLATTSMTIGISLAGLAIGLFLLSLSAVILWPAWVLIRLVMKAQPLITTDGKTVFKQRLGWSTSELSWENIGSVGLRGLWIILLDGRIKQSRFYQIMFGARGIWIPAVLIHGGGAKAMQFIEHYRPDLIEPLIHKVISGGR